MVIGLFFGSFNPIHVFHLEIAKFIIKKKLVEKVCFIVSPHNPLKEKKSLISAQQRLEMVRLACRRFKKFEVDDIEFLLPQPSYTINTLENLKKNYPDYTFKIIIGSDTLDQFELWKEYQKILNDFSIIVYPRKENYIIPDIFKDYNIIILKSKVSPLSSTLIRKNISEGIDASEYLPNDVYKYLINNNLLIKK